MKWGVRRYQNKDGSLTRAGRRRQAELSTSYGEKKDAYKTARKEFSKAYQDYDSKSNQAYSLSKRKREENRQRWNTVLEKEAQLKEAKKEYKKAKAERKQAIQTAEKEYTGEKLKKSSDDYRNKMLLKYAGKDPQKVAFYTNASDELIQKEFMRRENVKKAVIAGAAVVGVGAACMIAYQMSAKKQLQGLGDKVTEDAAKKVLKTAKEDLDYVIPQGSEIHRMTGYSGFDLQKTVGQRTYVTVTDSDRASYALFLKDWSGTGERYDVTLKAMKDIIAPSDKKARQIFKDVYDSNPEYKKELEKTLINAYAAISKLPKDAPAIRKQVMQDLKDPFGAGMYAFVRQGRDSEILTEAYVKAGYSAIVDYFDKGSLGKQPMILFDAAGTTSKVNEVLIQQGGRFVDYAMKMKYKYMLLKDLTHPMQKYAI